MIHQIRWTAEKITRRLKLIEPLVYRQQHPLPPFRYSQLAGPHISPPVAPDLDDSSWPVIEPNSYWGAWVSNFCLRTMFQVPTDWSSSHSIALYLPIGQAGDFSHPEALVYVNGRAYAACDRHHQEVSLPSIWCNGLPHHLALHGWTGLGGYMNSEPTQLFMKPCLVVQIDQPLRDFVATVRVALGIAQKLDPNEPAKGHLLEALHTAFTLLDTREPLGDGFYASVPTAHQALKAGIEPAGLPLNVNVIATGHAHIDVAWLWTLEQTRHKARRTFCNVLRLMEQFPDYHFTQSQPQLYEFVRQDDPELFAGIQEAVKNGRWEAIGGMWVEADCNLSGPESLARQFLLGRSFFREHFGQMAESPVLWLPDVFGYAWNLPQLIKQAGLEYFFTIKIGWSQYNRLPYDSFWWQGLDGTRVLTHFSTTQEEGSAYASTYNAAVTPGQVRGTWTNFRQKDLTHQGKIPPLLMAYGFGDGGGGPTREMLENQREMARFPATPRIRQGSVYEFFRELAQFGKVLPVWDGELYLELHRGTYTTQGRNKRANREMEFLLHDAEFLATYAYQLTLTYTLHYQYPAEQLRQAWQLVCLNQFHDIIPGSSIGSVYVESQMQYEKVRQLARQVKEEALSVIAEWLGGELLVINPTSFTRQDLAFWLGGNGEWQRADGTAVATQLTDNGLLLDLGELPPYSVTSLVRYDGAKNLSTDKLVASSQLLENRYLRVEFNAAGDIVRIYDKENQREVLPPGALANQFQAFEDRPLEWDAWDIDIFYDDQMWLAEPATSITVLESGPLRGLLEIKRPILHSKLVQHISLEENGRSLNFETWVDWRERHILLKVAFPVDILSPTATYEVQWGNVERPTHRNTSWDWARFETCAQKWVDLSEGGYGVSLLNNGKYGHDIQGHTIRLSLLRSPTMPDATADLGEHHFSYALLPHNGRWGAETVREAYALNNPLLVASITPPSKTDASLLSSFITCHPPHVIIETVKWAEDGNGIIVRLYEFQRERGTVQLTTSFPFQTVWKANLLEENQIQIHGEKQLVSLFIKPYEIVTLRFTTETTITEATGNMY